MTDNTIKDQAPLQVGFVATGDELTQGDILNTNGRTMAHQLHEAGFHVTQHSIVDDDETHIAAAINYQLQHHDIVIISGGLGPTSDDRTRFALAKCLNKPLVFHEPSWNHICQRLKSVNLQADEHNRQQAFFPEGATVLENLNGTASGCYLTVNEKMIFMLPGPPNECLPLFAEKVMPILQPFSIAHFHFKWLLMGASEGDVAALLDKALSHIDCRTGYRWAYPYLEFKVYTNSLENLQQAEQHTEPLLTPYLVSKHAINYQQQLLDKLQQSDYKLQFSDDLLSKYIQSALLNNHTYQNLTATDDAQIITVAVSGLNAYWEQKKTPTSTDVTITISYDDIISSETLPLYYRDHQLLDYLVALVCKQVLKFIAQI
jgi:nicotinamide-nucleotide amidase